MGSDFPRSKAAIRIPNQEAGTLYRLCVQYENKNVKKISHLGRIMLPLIYFGISMYGYPMSCRVLPPTTSIQDILSDTNTDEVLTTIFQSKNRKRLEVLCELFTSPEYWEEAGYTADHQEFYLRYKTECIRQILCKAKEKPYLILTAADTSYIEPRSYSRYLGYSQPDPKYMLRMVFKESDICNSGLVQYLIDNEVARVFTVYNPPISCCVFKHGKALNTPLESSYSGPKATFYFKGNNLKELFQIESRYTSMKILDNEPRRTFLGIIVYVQAVESYKQLDGCETVVNFSHVEFGSYPAIRLY